MKRRDFLKSCSMLSAGVVVGPGLNLEASGAPPSLNFKTKHLILIVNGNGSRKADYYEEHETAPSFRRIMANATVCEEDHNDTTGNHGYMNTELFTGRDNASNIPAFPTIPHYIRKAHGDEATNYWYLQGVSQYRVWRFSDRYLCSHPDYRSKSSWPVSLTMQAAFHEGNKKSPAELARLNFPDDMDVTPKEMKLLEEFIEARYQANDYTPNMKRPTLWRTPFTEEMRVLHMVPKILAAFKPKVIIVQINGHDTGHGGGALNLEETGFGDYLKCINYTDELLGNLYDFVTKDPYFSKNTAIVMRPETGRDDEMNLYEELNHSDGYYQTHRNASLWYGPDFKTGLVVKDVVNRLDVCQTITEIFGVNAHMSKGSFRSMIFKDHVGKLAPYKPVHITVQG